MSGPPELPDYARERLARYRPILGDDWQTFLAALQRPLPVGAWRNDARVSAEQLEAFVQAIEPGLSLERLRWLDRGYRLWAAAEAPPGAGTTSGSAAGNTAAPARAPDPRPGNRLSRALGLLHLQEEVSMIPAVLLDPQPGERILDLCGAPGNKTALISSLMEDRGTVICNDTDLKRLRAGRPGWERLGLTCIAATNHEGGSFPGDPGTYDRVLVDAPCSGEGTSRREISALRPGPPGYYRMLHGRQRRILMRALELCRPGGRVVYSTCTYAPEEDELVIADVLARYRERRAAGDRSATGDPRLLTARLDGLEGSPGLTTWDGRELGEELSRTLRIWPHQNDSGGFFVAVIEKEADGEPAGTQAGRPAPGSQVAAPAAFPPGRARLGPGCRMVDPAPYLEVLSERFGMDPGKFTARYRFFTGGRKYLYVLSGNHAVPPGPELSFSGIKFMRISMKVPKLTTEAAVAFGSHAVRNVVDLDPAQARAYFTRRSIELSAGACATCTGAGYVLVRVAAVTVGTGYLRAAAGGYTLESWFPKHWAEVVPL